MVAKDKSKLFLYTHWYLPVLTCNKFGSRMNHIRPYTDAWLPDLDLTRLFYVGYTEQMSAAGLHGYVRVGGTRDRPAAAGAGAPVHDGGRGAAPRLRAQHHRRHQG